jgi:hypothetical protein
MIKQTNNLEETEVENTSFAPLKKYFIFIIIAITIVLIALRILIDLFEFPELMEISRDIDFFILQEGFKNGLINFYDPIDLPEDIPNWPPYYLYYWYFVFFPIGIIPFNIGVYIWDILRLLCASYVVIKAYDMFKSRNDIFLFFIMLVIGFTIDAWFNNCNFVIIFFSFNSYLYLEKDKKWISGIFFALSLIKINSFLFLPILLVVKRIKLRDLFYYIIPFFLICIPYLIFPNYLTQMINNWLFSDEKIQGIFIFDSILWKALQPSHFMFIGLLFIVFLENINQEKRKNQFRILILLVLIFFNIYSLIVVFILPTYLF